MSSCTHAMTIVIPHRRWSLEPALWPVSHAIARLSLWDFEPCEKEEKNVCERDKIRKTEKNHITTLLRLLEWFFLSFFRALFSLLRFERVNEYVRPCSYCFIHANQRNSCNRNFLRNEMEMAFSCIPSKSIKVGSIFFTCCIIHINYILKCIHLRLLTL